jgi:hypothetical protein
VPVRRIAGGAPLPRVKPPRSKTRRTTTWSVFFVTINSNKVPYNGAHEDLLVRLCQDATLATFDQNDIGPAVKFLPDFEGDTYDANVRSYRFKGNVEVGARRNKAVHSHTTVLVQHDSRIHFDARVLGDKFRMAWNLLAPKAEQITARPYVNIAAASHSVANFILYQQKDEDTVPVRSSQSSTGFIDTDTGNALRPPKS